VKDQRRCFTTKPIEFINRHHTIVIRMYIFFAILRTDENDCSLNAVRIAWSIIFGPLILASPLYSESRAVPWCILSQSSRRLHQNRGLQQIIREWLRLIILACREIGKSSACPFCMMPYLNIIIGHSVIQKLAVWWAERYPNNYLMK
jgi:hypothetical protein